MYEHVKKIQQKIGGVSALVKYFKPSDDTVLTKKESMHRVAKLMASKFNNGANL